MHPTTVALREELISPQAVEVTPVSVPRLSLPAIVQEPPRLGQFGEATIQQTPAVAPAPIKGSFGQPASALTSAIVSKRVQVGGLAAVEAVAKAGDRQGGVANSGLNAVTLAAPRSLNGPPRASAAPALTIDFKPKPAYSDEARHLRIEGEVILKVRFKSSGFAEPVELIQGLGHGLDESAWAATKEIRFHLNAGEESDQIAAVHFIFRLAY